MHKIPLTPAEFLSDPQFKEEINKIVEDNLRALREREDPPPGMKYKRTDLDRMIESERFTTDILLDSIEPIWAKKSTLPPFERKVISQVCSTALVNTTVYYNNLNVSESLTPKRDPNQL